MKVLYIYGLGRSGSTTLSTYLGKWDCLIAVGEMMHSYYKLKKRMKNEICTCGRNGYDCPFWRGFSDYTTNKDLDNPVLYLRHFVDYIKETRSTVSLIVDSSKILSDLHNWIDLAKTQPEVQLYVVHLIRDVRGWFYSRYKRITTQSQKVQSFLYPWRWYRATFRNIHSLEELNLRQMTLGYEEFVFQRNRMTKEIFNFVGLPYEKKNNELDDSLTHELSSKSLLIKNSNKIEYDFTWYSNWICSIIPFLYYPVFKLNIEMVYSNQPSNFFKSYSDLKLQNGEAKHGKHS